MAARPRTPAAPRPPRRRAPDDETEWSDRVLEEVDLANRILTREDVERCVFRGCRMTGFEVPDGTLTDVRLTACRLDLAAVRLTACTRVRFEDCDLREADFYDARLQDVVFADCDLTRADFSRVRSARVSLEGCRLDGLRGTDGLRGMLISWDDVLALAPSLAADAGLVLREDDDEEA